MVILIGAGSFVTYLVALVLDFSKLSKYTFILTIIALITFIFYRNIDRNLREISERIRDL